jgi:hypothetical protein
MVAVLVDGDSFRADKLQVWGEGVSAVRMSNAGSTCTRTDDESRQRVDVRAEGQFRRDRAVFRLQLLHELRRIAPVTKR